MHLVGDMIGLLDALGEKRAVIVGHDWGSIVAWNAALLRPDRFRAVVGMSVPFLPRLPMRPLGDDEGDGRRSLLLHPLLPGAGQGGGGARPARAGDDAQDALHRVRIGRPASQLRKLRAAEDRALPRRHGRSRRSCRPGSREADLDVYVGEFERTGFRGGLNWYRNFDRNWELLAPFADRRITVPALFVGGLRDAVVTGPELAGEGPDVQDAGLVLRRPARQGADRRRGPLEPAGSPERRRTRRCSSSSPASTD